MRIPVLLLVGVVSFVSCAPSRYVYSPTITTGAEISGASAASYDIPREAPHGRVQLAVLGVAPDAENPSVILVHVAVIVFNRSSETWTIRPAEQRLELAHDDGLETVYSTIASSPAIEIAPGGTRRVTLVFRLPERVKNAREVPELSAVWVVRAGSRVVAQRTPFARFRAAPPPMPPPIPHTRGQR